MKLRIAVPIADAFRTPSIREDVHFHVDSDGRHFPCDYDRCESPGATPPEARSAGSR